MSLKPKLKQPATPALPAGESPISALPTPPTPVEEISALQQSIAEMERTHQIALRREEQLTHRHQQDSVRLQAELTALLESPLLRILSNGGNLPEIEERLAVLCEKCAHANAAIKGSLMLKIGVASGRSGDGSLEFSITDKVTQPAEDEGACILWFGRDGKLSESNARQRELLDVPTGPRRPNPTDAEKLEAAE